MKISLTLVGNTLLASTISLVRAEISHEEVSPASMSFGLLIPADVETFSPHLKSLSPAASSTKFPTQYSSNWAGSLITPPPLGHFIAVLGTFTVPLASPPVAGAGTWQGAAWTGLSDQSSILQAGVFWNVTVSGTGAYSYSYNAFYQWFPNPPALLTVAVKAGDIIGIWCAATSATSGWCQINNESTGNVTFWHMNAPTGTSLGGTSVEWIFEDFYNQNGQVAFANFGGVTFTNCFAIASSNSSAQTIIHANATTAYPDDMAQANSNGATETITTVSHPPYADQVVEINYIGF